MQPLTEVVKLKVNEMLQVTSPLGVGDPVPTGKGDGNSVLGLGDEEYNDFDW